MAEHMGFKKAQKSIAKKQGIPMKNAGAILAAGARRPGRERCDRARRPSGPRGRPRGSARARCRCARGGEA